MSGQATMNMQQHRRRGWRAHSLLRAILLGVTLLLASASLPLLAAEPSARLGAMSGTVAVVHADGSAVQPAGPDTPLGPGDRIATVGKSGATLTLAGIGQIELGAATTLVIRDLRVDGSTTVILIEVAQGTTVHRLSSVSGTLDYRVVDPSGQAVAHARGDASFGIARDDNGSVTAGCEQCSDGVFTFPADRSGLLSGRTRTLTPRGDVQDDSLDGGIFDALTRGADVDGQGGKTPDGNRLPAGQRTGSRDSRPDRGDGDDDAANWLPVGATPATATPTTGPTATATVTPTPSVISVFATIANFVYLPDPIVIRAGQTVRWTNLDPAVHTVTADNHTFTSPRLSQGDTYTMTFPQPGTYPYFCEPHPFMHGTVEVHP
jgi:plastocyanin